MNHGYHLYGLNVVSEVDLGDLPPAVAATVDVRIVRAAIPSWIRPGAAVGFQVAPGEVRFEFPGIARFEIVGGTSIGIDTNRDRSAALRWRLLGPAFGVLLNQRGIPALHSTVVDVGGRAIGFVGNSGAGKSTLAAHLMKRGHRLLIDDVCALTVDGRRSWAAPGNGRLRLLSDAMNALDLTEAERLTSDLEKFELMAEQPTRDPIRLDALLELTVADGVSIAELDLRECLSLCLRHTYCRQFLEQMGLKADNFKQCAAVADTIAAYRLGRPLDLSRMPETIDLLERTFANAVTP